MERFFSFFRPRWFFLKGFTKEFSALKSRVFYPNCTIFSGATLLAFLYFLRFFSFVFCNGLLYIYIFEHFIFLCFYSTYKNGVEPGKLSIFYRIFMKMLLFHILAQFCMLRKNTKNYAIFKKQIYSNPTQKTKLKNIKN